MENEQYLQRVLALVCSVFDAYSAVLLLRRGEHVYRPEAWFSLGDNVNPASEVTSGKGLIGAIVSSRQPMLINNFNSSKGRLEYYPQDMEQHIKAFMGCPLRDDIGVLCLDSKRTFSFSEKDQKLLHLFADLIYDYRLRLVAACKHEVESTYYHSLQLIQGLRKRLTRWNAFLENFLMLLSESTGFDYCFLAVRDDKGKSFFLEGSSRPFFSGRNQDLNFPLGAGLVGWVFKNGSAVYLGGEERSGATSPLFGKNVHTPAFRSLMCLPLQFSRATRGVLGFAHEDDIEISDHIKTFSEMAAVNLELFLENLHLKSKLRQKTTE